MNLAADWPYIEDVAAARIRNHEHRKRHVSKFGNKLEIAGAAGELAARRYFGLPEKLHTDLDGGTDFVWHGWKIDVKTTKLSSRTPELYLQWPKDKPVKAEIVWVVGLNRDTKDAVMMGWVPGTWVKEAPVNPNRPIPCHEISYEKLLPPWKLWVS